MFRYLLLKNCMYRRSAYSSLLQVIKASPVYQDTHFNKNKKRFIILSICVKIGFYEALLGNGLKVKGVTIATGFTRVAKPQNVR